ncbi:MAG TPA: hypothetical protein VGD79_06265 [Thermoanaerobaculia bacterium]
MTRILLSVLFALSLSAQSQRIVLDPPGPTSAAAVTADVYVTCDPQSHTLTRLGNVIKIQVTAGPFQALCDPPIPARYSVPLGVLPAGEYRIEVGTGALDAIEARTFIVRNVAEGAFDIHPFAVPTYGDVQMRIDTGDLPQVTKIIVGGVTVAPANITQSGGVYTFEAPEHAKGLADVTIETAGGTHTLAGAVYYFDHSAPPDNSVFERILFPVLFSSAGAHGSEWVSEVALSNPNPWAVKAFTDLMLFNCPDCGVGQYFQPEDDTVFAGFGYPRGIALLVPRAEAGDLSFSLRVRDTSRVAEGYGTQVPVVREKDLFRNTDLTLLNIPVDIRTRVKLRVYAFDTNNHDATVTVHYVDAPNVAEATFSLPMRRECRPFDCPAVPWYGELDLPNDHNAGNMNVYVTLGFPEVSAWAFASVTNNETQQVTLVTADGNGGRP